MPHADREHVTDGSPCWCRPRPMVPCGQCDGDAAPCWLCSGSGLVDAPEGYDDASTLVLVHREG